MPIFDNRYTGLAPTILVIIIVWAVAAVLMLTGTLVAARQIDTKVNEDITQSVPQIDQDLNNVKLAARTARIADRIEVAAKPLEGQLNTIIDEANSIRGTVGTRRGREDDIFSTAVTINGTVHRIRRTAGGIGGIVGGIHSGVLNIGGSVQSIRRNVVSIQGRAAGILDTAERIDATGCPTPERVEDERRSVGGAPVTGLCGVAGINVRGDIAINTVGGIFDDLHNVMLEVGTPPDVRGHGFEPTRTRATIHGHANSIDCRIDEIFRAGGAIDLIGGGTLNPAGRSQYCGH